MRVLDRRSTANETVWIGTWLASPDVSLRLNKKTFCLPIADEGAQRHKHIQPGRSRDNLQRRERKESATKKECQGYLMIGNNFDPNDIHLDENTASTSQTTIYCVITSFQPASFIQVDPSCAVPRPDKIHNAPTTTMRCVNGEWRVC